MCSGWLLGGSHSFNGEEIPPQESSKTSVQTEEQRQGKNQSVVFFFFAHIHDRFAFVMKSVT